MKRFEHWPSLLHDFFAERRTMPFAWGSNDCLSFGAAWVLQATGEQIMSYVYADEAGADRILSRFDNSIATAIASALGEPYATPKEARRGDICTVRVIGRDGGEVEVAGVVLDHRVMAPGTRGAVVLPRSHMIAAWKV